MKLLVFGGLGFIGSNFVNYLSRNSQEFEVKILDGFRYSARPENVRDSNLVPTHPTLLQNNDDYKQMLEDFDWVINFAAETHNDNSILDPKAFLDSNVTGVYKLLEALRGTGTKLLQVSTDEVYGDTEISSSVHFKETSALRPSSPYSASKAAADSLVQAWGRTYEIPYIISRCTNNYGPNQHREKFIPKILHSIGKQVPIEIYGSGENIRDWIHVDDHSSAIIDLLRHGDIGEIYNVGAQNQLSNLDLALRIIDSFGGSRDQIRMIADRPGHDRRYALDTSKIEDLGWRPTRTKEGFSKETLFQSF